MTRHDVIDLLRQACAAAGGQKAWAQQNQITETFVSDVMRGRKEPSGRMLAALGVRLVVAKTYEEIG